jgi:hypothetical protein
VNSESLEDFAKHDLVGRYAFMGSDRRRQDVRLLVDISEKVAELTLNRSQGKP